MTTSPGSSIGTISSMTASTAPPALTMIMTLRGRLSWAMSSLGEWAPTIFLPLARPLEQPPPGPRLAHAGHDRGRAHPPAGDAAPDPVPVLPLHPRLPRPRERLGGPARHGAAARGGRPGLRPRRRRLRRRHFLLGLLDPRDPQHRERDPLVRALGVRPRARPLGHLRRP